MMEIASQPPDPTPLRQPLRPEELRDQHVRVPRC